jgi:hypothetical protein
MRRRRELDPDTFGGYACARSLCRILNRLDDAKTTRQVGAMLARYFLTLKELREVENRRVWLDLLSLVRHRSLGDTERMPWPRDVVTHARTVMVSAWRDELEARGLRPAATRGRRATEATLSARPWGKAARPPVATD